MRGRVRNRILKTVLASYNTNIGNNDEDRMEWSFEKLHLLLARTSEIMRIDPVSNDIG